MEYSRELLFFFSALGAFNGLLMGLYFLFFAKPHHLSFRFLGAVLISLSIRIGKSVFFYFDHGLAVEYLQFGLSACVLIGPFFYFYVKALAAPPDQPYKKWRIHLAVLTPLILVGGFLYPYGDNLELWRGWVIYGIYLVWLIYLLAAGYELRTTFSSLFSGKSKRNSHAIWVCSLYVGNCAIWTAYMFAGFMSYILGALLFSFMLYLLVLLLILNKRNASLLPATHSKPKPKPHKIPDREATSLLEQLRNIMEEQELYRNPNLKLADVAKKLNLSPHRVSSLLNDHLGHGFPHFLNSYRIDQAKVLILSNQTHTLEAIGYDSGFNSKSTFFATFKKFTGTTPARFKSENQPPSSN